MNASEFISKFTALILCPENIKALEDYALIRTEESLKTVAEKEEQIERLIKQVSKLEDYRFKYKDR